MGITNKQYGKQVLPGYFTGTFKGDFSGDFTVTTLQTASGIAIRLVAIPFGSEIHEEATAQELDYTIPENSIIKNVWVNVIDAETVASDKTINVGRVGETSGFLSGIDVETTGLKKGTLADGAVTLGTLLYTNTDTAANPVPEPDLSSGDTKVTVQAGDDEATEITGEIIIELYERT